MPRLVLRWQHKDYLIEEASGRARKAWEIARGRKAWGKREIWDSYHGRGPLASTLAFAVRHPDYRDRPLWLVVSRLPGRRPWYPAFHRAGSQRRRRVACRLCATVAGGKLR